MLHYAACSRRLSAGPAISIKFFFLLLSSLCLLRTLLTQSPSAPPTRHLAPLRLFVSDASGNSHLRAQAVPLVNQQISIWLLACVNSSKQRQEVVEKNIDAARDTISCSSFSICVGISARHAQCVELVICGRRQRSLNSGSIIVFFPLSVCSPRVFGRLTVQLGTNFFPSLHRRTALYRTFILSGFRLPCAE